MAQSSKAGRVSVSSPVAVTINRHGGIIHRSCSAFVDVEPRDCNDFTGFGPVAPNLTFDAIGP